MKMKYKLPIILGLAMVCGMWACEEEDDRLDILTDGGVPSYIRFNEQVADTVQLFESGGNSNYTIELGIRVFEDVNMRVNLKGSAVYNTDYVIVNNSDSNTEGEQNAQFTMADDNSYVDISLPRNDTLTTNRATIQVQLLEDGVADGEKFVTLELAEATAENYGALRLGRIEGDVARTIQVLDVD